MQQLISIKRIPMDIEINVTPWKFEQDREVAREAAREAARQTGKSAAPAASAAKTPMPFINDFSDNDYFELGSSLAGSTPFAYYQPMSPATGSTAAGNNFMEDDLVSYIKNNPIRAQMASRPIESVTSQLVNASARQKNVINWSNGSSDYSFEANNTGDYQAIASKSAWKFVPSSVEVVINQMPSLEIEYLGSPLYFPRSADPNYVPPEGI